MSQPHHIDVHQHVTPEVYRTALESIGIKGSGERAWPESSPATLIAAMDRTGLAAAVVSVASPGAYFGDIAFTRRLVRAVNDDLAKVVADTPAVSPRSDWCRCPTSTRRYTTSNTRSTR